MGKDLTAHPLNGDSSEAQMMESLSELEGSAVVMDREEDIGKMEHLQLQEMRKEVD